MYQFWTNGVIAKVCSNALILYVSLSVGRYIYIEALYRKVNDTARISSPVISVSGSSTKCLKFWYHMYGPHIGTLNVYTNSTTLGSPIWSKTGTAGNAWKLATVEVQMRRSYSVSWT